MSEQTNIEWANHTASPWFGCTEVSPGCANCYARQLTLQKKWAGWGEGASRVRSKGFWKNAPAWNRKAQNAGRRPRMFTSLMDWLDPQVPVEWLADFLRVIAETPNLDWLLLTKRPELWQARLEAVGRTTSTGKGYAVAASWLNGAAPANVWFGVTCEDQTRANERLPILLCIPAKIRWVSAEPLLGPIKFRDDVLCQDPDCGRGVDWIVVGGESGSKRRDCGVEAIVDVAGQCQAAGVACFVKQDCAQRPGQQGRIPAHIWALKEEAAR